jgi:hypothetical protein
MKYLILISLLLLTQINSEDTCICKDNCDEKNEVGQSTWKLLHEMVKYNEDNEENSMHLGVFLESLSFIYPCEECRKHIRSFIEKSMEKGEEGMPKMNERFMCDFHNQINERLKKPLYDCDNFN